MQFGHIIDPPQWAARLHDIEIGFAVMEDAGDLIKCGGYGEELGCLSLAIEKAAHGVEFAEIECENV